MSLNLNSRKNNFKFFVPLEISKAKDSEGKEVMKIGGIASTIDRDTDGEVLDPSGFQLDYFLNNGFVNWHHQSKTNPNAVIGEPTKAEIRKEGLYIEAELYKDSKIAQQVWDLAKTLDKNKSKRKLGFSIEGKVVERDALDEKFVKKAIITGVAITPSPKNSSTILDILKGHFNDEAEDVEIVSTENDANGGLIEYVIDLLKPNGDRITVDKEYNVKVISKSLEATGNGTPLKKESLDKNKKNIENNFLGKEKNSNFDTLKKSEIFFETLNYTSDIEKAKQATKILFNNLNQNEMKNPKSDEIIKALQDLGVEITEDQLIKAEEKISKKDDEDKDEVEKAKKEEELKKKEELDAMEKAKKDLEDKEALEKAKKEMTDEDSEEELEKAVKKAEEDAKMLKDKLAKAKSAKKGEDIFKGIDAEELKKSIISEFEEKQTEGNNAILSKLDEMSKANETLVERIGVLENQNVGRKSVTTTKYIEKSFTEDELKNKTTMSLSRDRGRLGQILITKSGIEKGECNEFYMNAASELEATGNLSKAVIADLNINNNIVITQ